MTQQIDQSASPNAVLWPPEVVDRIKRVFEFHQNTKLTREQFHERPAPNEDNRPRGVQVFDVPRLALPTNLIPADVATISLLLEGREAVPHSRLDPPHDLRTLATWLYLGNGITKAHRTAPSNGDAFPCDVYVAAFSVEGLEPGLYYYNPREFSLRRLREGLQALTALMEGQPELAFLSHVPAALLVSTIFSRSTWRFQSRGYRAALLDAGQMIENLVLAGTAVGTYTDVRLAVGDAATRSLIGVASDAPFEQAEAVQAVITWSDPKPTEVAPAQTVVTELPAIVRQPSPATVVPYDLIPLIHEDCVGPGNVREIRPPLTETSTVPPSVPAYSREPSEPPHGGTSFGPLVMKRTPFVSFSRRPIMRDQFLAINRGAFGGPSYHPLLPAGKYASLVRPLWMAQDVVGVDPGVWYYHPQTDRWSMSARGLFRDDMAYLSGERAYAANASAVCVLIADLRHLMVHAGPDAYRLAHLEAGIVAHRIQVATESQGLAAVCTTDFYDEEFRQFFGLTPSGWEIIYEVMIGYHGNLDDDVPELVEEEDDAGTWID